MRDSTAVNRRSALLLAVFTGLLLTATAWLHRLQAASAASAGSRRTSGQRYGWSGILRTGWCAPHEELGSVSRMRLVRRMFG
ncbi:hypothetical protein AMK32_38270 [Streptomyces sp. CB01883]|nr:hypothetical protein AMK32_38270 [Streptomyces sp. CB01883]